MLNFLTIDVEDYFQVHAFSKVIRYEEWENFDCRVERNVNRILDILNSVPSPKSSLPYDLNNSLTQSSVPRLQSSDVGLHYSERQDSSTSGPKSGSPLTPFDSIKATFFVLGWIAKRFPNVIRRIKEQGHEIACHGYSHKLIYDQSEEEFRNDIRRAKGVLEDVIGEEVIGYRAPSYSITDRSQWAVKILIEEGFKYDSSIFPIRHDFYGMPDAPRFPFVVSFNGNSNLEFSVLNIESKTTHNLDLQPQHSVLNARQSEQHHSNTATLQHSITQSPINQKFNSPILSTQQSERQHSNTAARPDASCLMPHASKKLIEFPISTVRLLGMNLPISGGGYFRLFPYSLIRKGLKSINDKENKPFIFYVHPWEFDVDQPRMKTASNLSKFRHYVNLDKTEERFRRLLNDFKFSPIKEILDINSRFTIHNS